MQRLRSLRREASFLAVLLISLAGAAGPAPAAAGGAGEPGSGVLGELLPSFFFTLRFLEVRLWQWIALVAGVGLAVAASMAAAWLTMRVARPVISRSRTDLDDRLLHVLIGPLRLVWGVLFFYLGTLFLGLSEAARHNLAVAEQAVVTIALTWAVLRLVDLFGDRIEKLMILRGQDTARGLIPIGRHIAKVAVVALAVLTVLQAMSYPITGLIAGLGVGGIAVALAAQKTLENMFGALTLAADQPVRVGDFCRFGDRIGTVEEIGLRSTRVRTLDRTVVSVPNSEFSQLQLESFARRDKVWLHPILGLRYETSPDQLRWVLAEIRRMLLAHPRIDPEPARVRFLGFGAYSLDLEVFAYVLTDDWGEYLAVREDVNLRIMDIVERSGTGFAFPSQTIYAGRDGGLDEKATAAAERAVQEWRESEALPFPDLPDEEKEKIQHTLAWPPEGSALEPER